MNTNDNTFRVGTSLLNPAKPFMDLWYRVNQDFPDYKLLNQSGICPSVFATQQMLAVFIIQDQQNFLAVLILLVIFSESMLTAVANQLDGRARDMGIADMFDDRKMRTDIIKI